MSYHPISRIQRVRDLRRALTDRCGRHLPNDETGRRLLAIVIDHALLIAPDLAQRMALQLLPQITDAEVAYMIDKAGKGRMWQAKALANALGLTEATRLRLQITTIAAMNCSRAERKKAKRLARLAAEGNPALTINADA